MELEQVVANLVEQAERRLYGKYRGLVVDNADPEHLGRLKLQIPSVLGAEVVTGWAMPCLPYGGDVGQGFLFIPENGAGVWVEFEEGDLEFPIWVGTFWSKPGGDSELPKPNDPDGAEQSEVQDPPTRKIIKTKKGHTLQFEDADGSESITIYDGVNASVIVMDSSGIKVTDGANGHEIVLDSSGITINDGVNQSNKVVMEQSGVTIQDTNGNSITMSGPSGPTQVIKINGEKRVCLEGLVDWLLTHQHVGNMGAPTPLFPADMAILQLKMNLPGAAILSDNVKAK